MNSDNNELYDILLEKYLQESVKDNVNVQLLEFYLNKLHEINPDKKIPSIGVLQNPPVKYKKSNTDKKKNLSSKSVLKSSVICFFILLLLLGVYRIGNATFDDNMFNVSINNEEKRVTLNSVPENKTTDLWVPPGYQCVNTSFKENNIATSFVYDFENENHNIIFSIQYLKKPEDLSHWVETNGSSEELIIDNHIYYIAGNYDLTLIIWYRENIFYMLSSPEPKETLVKTLYTLPEEYK